jgi:NAD+ synthase (glutamine-hydrolysing)
MSTNATGPALTGPNLTGPALTDPNLIKVATCNLAQQALNFKENARRITESINTSKELGCVYRLGPELEIPGYSCEDHYYEKDTTTFSWISLKEIMETTPSDILCDIGMPVLHNGVLYNCRVFYLRAADAGAKPKIVLIRPKMFLAEDGNYREGRWFTGWSKDRMSKLDMFTLPEDLQLLTGQKEVPFGVAIVVANGVTIASEVCEELFTPESPNVIFGLEGVDIISNGSGSHFQLGKRHHRHELLASATDKNGGVYMYSNQLGCDGGRLVFDGNGMIYQNGNLLNVGEHLSFLEVEVVTAVVNLDAVRTYRSGIVSRNIQAAHKDVDIPRVDIQSIPGLETYNLIKKQGLIPYAESKPMSIKIMSEYDTDVEMSEYEEASLAISRYLWDYLILTGNGGFYLPLSGGVDSSATAALVYLMCDKIVNMLNDSKKTTLQTHIFGALKKRIFTTFQMQECLKYYDNVTSGAESAGKPLTTRDLMYRVLHTANMPTKNNAGEIRNFADRLANALGSYHITAHIDSVFIEMKNLVEKIEKKQQNKVMLLDVVKSANETYPTDAESSNNFQMNVPRFKLKDGDWLSNLSIQNIQARLRMITAYYTQQILPSNRFNEEILGKLWVGYKNARNATIGHDTTEPENTEFLTNLEGSPDDTITDSEEIAIYNTVFGFYKIQDVSNPKYSTLHKEIILAKRPNTPGLLVLASSNSDEALRGFYTKYDASSADINPISSLDKGFLKRLLNWCAQTTSMHQKGFQEGYQFNMLEDIINITASPELTPVDKDGNIQDDEVAIGMTYDDVQLLGVLRKKERLGPLGMFYKLLEIKKGQSWTSVLLDVKKYREVVSPINVYNKIAMFFKQYSTHRHKMNILTNGIHLTNYSPDDNRFDHRPFVTDIFWTKQMEEIKKIAENMEHTWKDDMHDVYDNFKLEYPHSAEASETPSKTSPESATELREKEAAESVKIWNTIWEGRRNRLKDEDKGIVDFYEALYNFEEARKLAKKVKGAVEGATTLAKLQAIATRDILNKTQIVLPPDYAIILSEPAPQAAAAAAPIPEVATNNTHNGGKQRNKTYKKRKLNAKRTYKN